MKEYNMAMRIKLPSVRSR